MKKSIIIFLMLFLSSQSFADMVRQTDHRVYISPEQWKTYPYNLTLAASTGCTAQYISRRLISTAAHCVQGNDIITFTGPYGKFTARLIAMGNSIDNNGKLVDPKNDWAIYIIDDQRYFSKSGYFHVMPKSKLYSDQVQVAGFGALRILSDSEIKTIKQLTNDLLTYREKYFPDLEFVNNTKNVNSVDFMSSSDFALVLDTELEKRGIAPIFSDSENLKLTTTCSILSLNSPKNDYQLGHNCDGAPGNSGSGLVVKKDDKYNLAGIFSRSVNTIDSRFFVQSLATQTDYFYQTVKSLINEYEPDSEIDYEDYKETVSYKNSLFICKLIQSETMTTVTNYQNIFQSKWNQCKNGGQFAGIKFSDTESYRSEFYKAAAAELQKNGKGSAWDVYDVVCDNPSPEYLSQKKQMMKNIEDSSEYFKNNINCSFPDKQSIYTGAKKFIQDKIDLLTEIPDVPSSLYMVVRVVLKKSDAENIAKDVANKTGYTAYVKPSGLLIGYYVYIPDLPIDKASRLVDILYGYTPLCCTNIDFTNQVNCKTGKK